MAAAGILVGQSMAARQTPQMASFYDREYTDFERANFVKAFHCPSSSEQYETRHCEHCEAVLVPPRTKDWNRVSSDRS